MSVTVFDLVQDIIYQRRVVQNAAIDAINLIFAFLVGVIKNSSSLRKFHLCPHWT